MFKRTTWTGSVLAAGLAFTAQAQQSINLGQADYSTWTLFGAAQSSAPVVANGYLYRDIQLTIASTGDSAGAAFAPSPITLNFNQPFDFHFPFFIRPGGIRGDGLTFTLTDVPGVGSGGSDLGYGGSSSNSVAFAVDTFHFDGEPVSPSLQVLKAGSVTPVAFTETGLNDGIRDQNLQWIGQVQYTPSGLGDERGTLTGSISRPDFGAFSVSAVIDGTVVGTRLTDAQTSEYLGNSVYFGFTAANGLADDGHVVTSAVPVPEPESWAMLVVGLGLILGRLRQRAARSG